MAFFDKIKAAAEAVGDKTNEMIEVTKLNSKVSAENSAIGEKKTQIGELIFSRFVSGQSFDPEISGLCEGIQSHLAAIEALQKEIVAVKAGMAKAAPEAPSGATCPACGAANAPGVRFCGSCGGKLE
jgi:hypothetical protein